MTYDWLFFLYIKTEPQRTSSSKQVMSCDKKIVLEKKKLFDFRLLSSW